MLLSINFIKVLTDTSIDSKMSKMQDAKGIIALLFQLNYNLKKKEMCIGRDFIVSKLILGLFSKNFVGLIIGA